MAETNCPECGHTISTWTVRCPGCGRIDLRPILQAVLFVAVAVAAAWWWVSKHGVPDFLQWPS